MNACKNCGQEPRRSFYTYCSNFCQNEYQYRAYIESWKKGVESGTRGVSTSVLSRHLRRYLVEKYGEKCSVCKWAKRHQMTQRVPLEVDHQDGNAENNSEKNLRLICPNCHALTSNFRNLNKGKGRKWRRERYVKV